MAYKASQFDVPDNHKDILPENLCQFETVIWQVFAAGWVNGNLYRPYFTLCPQDEAVRAGLLEECSGRNMYRLTDTALGYLKKVYGK